MSVAETLGVAIKLWDACEYQSCADFAAPLHKQLSRGYDHCSLMRVPQSVADWREGSKTRRTRTNRAERLGYQGRVIQREEYAEDIYDINTSREVRQGRPMARSYTERQNYLPLPQYPCPLHAIETYGVVDAHGTLAAYLWLYRSGELALVSQILGHADHERNDVMYLLFQSVIADQCLLGGWFVYNRHDSGTDGLRYFKEKLGFTGMDVAWLL